MPHGMGSMGHDEDVDMDDVMDEVRHAPAGGQGPLRGPLSNYGPI